jgi:hypothetical protein
LSGFGSGFLANGGSYITLVPLRHESHMNAEDIAFVMIIETLYGSCGEHPVAGDVAEVDQSQLLTFELHLPSICPTSVPTICIVVIK